jgi:predicted O-methyltransferase YrrM
MGYPAWNLLYYTLLASLRSEEPVVVETRTNLGFSTIIMAQALKDAEARSVVRTVELSSEIAKLAEEHARDGLLR